MTTLHRVAFYPACFKDIQAAMLLEAYAEHVVVCDINPALERYWQDIIQKRGKGARWTFRLGDAQFVLSGLEQIDVAFQRRDSRDGSCLSVVRRPLLPTILRRMPLSGGLFITDGSNCWENEFRRLTRPCGVVRYGWQLKPRERQPLLKRAGVWLIDAVPVAA